MSPKAAISLLGFVVLVHVLCVGRYPSAGGDEVLHSVAAYTFLHEGRLAMPVFPGPGHLETVSFLPPGPALFIAASYALLGFGLFQTKAVFLLLGLATCGFAFSIARSLTGDARFGALAAAVLALDGVTFYSWQTARYEAPLAFALAFHLWLLFRDQADDVRPWTSRFLLVGVSLGFAFLSYFPFVAPAALLTLLYLVDRWRSDPSTDRGWRFLVSAGATGVGFLLVTFPFFLLVQRYPQQFHDQVTRYSSLYGAKGSGVFAVLGLVAQELHRYRGYAVQMLGGFNVLLWIAAFAVALWIGRRDRPVRLLGVGAVIWIAMLALYGQKHPRYLAVLAVFGSVLAAVVLSRLTAGGHRRSAGLVRALLACSILVGLGRTAIAGFTTLFQWEARDYAAYRVFVRESVLPGSSVIAPQTAWYALAGRTSRLRLYTQGQGWDGYTDELYGQPLLEDPSTLKGVSHILVDASVQHRLPGLVGYAEDQLDLVKEFDPPFRPLPWSSPAALRLKVFEKR